MKNHVKVIQSNIHVENNSNVVISGDKVHIEDKQPQSTSVWKALWKMVSFLWRKA